MTFHWLKRYLPRSLTGRATLILLLPVITVLIVVSVVSVQRLFEGVTRQMTVTAAREISLVMAADGDALARALDMERRVLASNEVPEADLRRWHDLTGIVVIRELRRLVPEISAVHLPDNQVVALYVEGRDGALELRFDRRRVSASNPHQLLVNMLVFGALMTVVAYIYLRNQLRPITRLARAAEAFGRGRMEDYRPRGAIEVRAAGHAFLDMRARIERQIEQRTLMLSGVSHDLRTPLTRLKLSLTMLEDQEEAAPMLRDVDDMQRLLDEFLAFARDAAEDEPEVVDPVALVRRIVEDCVRSALPVTLHEVRGEGALPLRPGGIRRAVENLINNAVRYGSRAEVSVQITARTLRITVEDDGPGIPEALREEAVKPFARLEPGRNQDKGTGVGLGLAITTDIARVHGGNLRLGPSERLGGLCADIVIAR
ncbi:HAMP domain-containing protein [Roseovarius sp. LXJ103]|uniref:ATP-binding protein n=1 Tax=Roseovarius carneus TaxID=2853164 RepID=UPI000D618729|nr:ATP-binding protein [Roseovarius carneus]MBZ8119278.1 HAMP domain-containing protein [Roseovarius carneus]PWE35100.1 two-component sensor histidine kinase [Pelagicola sp. LXJ1103]